ncbi:MAG: Mur ligase family protein, partial [Actinomycetota bacterium]|nr:Mur ligase family protein [Actinomycetota bacterium]
MKLGEILENVQNSDFERLGVINDVEVHGLSYDSRLITIGDLFFCFQGENTDSHDFVYDAIKGGASALVVERKIDTDFPQVISSSSRKMMSEVAEIFYDFPSREITTVGVTGTNGKTTTVNILSAIAEAAGKQSKTIGTSTGQLTTPEAPDLQRQIRDSVVAGASFLAMEVSSHA